MTSNALGPIFAFFASVTWAIGSANYAKMSRKFSPFQVNLTRATFALPLFFLATFVTAGGFAEGFAAFRELGWSQVGWFSLSMTASYGLGDAFFLWSTMSLGVPGALAIASGYPIFTVLFGIFFLGETINALQWLGLLIAIGGIAVVILTDPQPAAASDSPAKPPSRKAVGILLATLTAVCWAANTFAVSRGGIGVHPAAANTLRMTIGMILISFFSVTVGRQRPSWMSRDAVRSFAWVFVIEAFLGSYFFLYGLARSPLILGSVLTSLAPVIAVPVTIVLRLERFSWVRTGAVAAVVLGLALL